VLTESARDYDVTVLGAAGRRNRSAAGLGPVASRVIEHSNATVFIGRPSRGETAGRILAAVDGSDGSLRAVEKLAELVNLTAADVTLLHVVETPWLQGGYDHEWAIDEKETEFERELAQEAELVLEAARDRLPPRAAVTTLIYEGLPADEILGEAERGDYDLIVMGASGGSDLKHQMLGSVSTKVAWDAPCSVLLVRPGDTR
jgi:nucleotide-binding universal stress UspA family protein